MGISSVSPGSLLLICLIIMMLFGTKRLRSVGEDIGHAVKSFKKGLQSDDTENEPKT